MRKIHSFFWWQGFLFMSLLVVAMGPPAIAAPSPGSSGAAWAKPAWMSDEQPHTSRAKRSESTSDVSPYSPGSHNIALDLGQIFLVGDLTRFDNSIGAQLHYSYGVSDIFAFDSSIGYSQHSANKYSVASLAAGVRANLPGLDKIIPYGIAGFGFYVPSYLDTTVVVPAATPENPNPGQPSVSAFLFGLHIGPGVDLALSKNVFFGAALTYHQMFGVTKTLANGTPLGLGGGYLSFLMHVGVTF